ncbi:MAG: hypothetical protein AAF478_03685 [Pseudomonadota bacterium]
MSLENLPVENRSEFNVTSASTLHHLIAVGVTCVALWGAIAATIGA